MTQLARFDAGAALSESDTDNYLLAHPYAVPPDRQINAPVLGSQFPGLGTSMVNWRAEATTHVGTNYSRQCYRAVKFHVACLYPASEASANGTNLQQTPGRRVTAFYDTRLVG